MQPVGHVSGIYTYALGQKYGSLDAVLVLNSQYDSTGTYGGIPGNIPLGWNIPGNVMVSLEYSTIGSTT